MNSGTYYGSYNARFLTPEQVAESFVPLPSYTRLARVGHTVLMGPRGCGKTTLLKMLTRRALNTWRSAHSVTRSPRPFSEPLYEALYIPADVRWLSEVRGANTSGSIDTRTREQIQRVMITTSVMYEAADLFRVMVIDGTQNIGERRIYSESICSALIRLWGFENIVPSFTDVMDSIQDLVISLRGALNDSDSERTKDYLRSLPRFMYAHSLDVATQACNRIHSLLPEQIRPIKWAICFDELEIAPTWLHRELLSSLRSIDQSFFLKLTWNPIFPTAETAPEPGADFTIIRLWNSHIKDPAQFCEALTSAVIRSRFPRRKLTPSKLLGHSVFAEDSPNDDHEYRRGSVVYKAMVDLAKNDTSFRGALYDRNIDSADPVPSDDPVLRESQMNEFFRKAKPIVLLRQAFLRDAGERRPRKSVTLYAGKQAVFAVSEGNPRWLLGLLNELCDACEWSSSGVNGGRVPPTKQAAIITATSRRFIAKVKATPIVSEIMSDAHSIPVGRLVSMLAEHFASELYGPTFRLDPSGSFKVGASISSAIELTIKRALELGAIVHIGKSNMDVPLGVVGERFRLSFMICPAFKLALRNYRHVGLAIDRSYKDDHRKVDAAQLSFKLE